MFTSGEYFFQHVLDLGAKYSVRMQRILTARGLYLRDLIDDRLELIDTWSDFDGVIPDDTNAEVYLGSLILRKLLHLLSMKTATGFNLMVIQLYVRHAAKHVQACSRSQRLSLRNGFR